MQSSSGKKRSRESTDAKEDSPESRARPNSSRSRSQGAREPAKEGQNPKSERRVSGSAGAGTHIDFGQFEPFSESGRKSHPEGGHKRGREHKAEGARNSTVKQPNSTTHSIATRGGVARTRAAAERSGVMPDANAHVSSPNVVVTTGAALSGSLLVANSAAEAARNIINPVACLMTAGYPGSIAPTPLATAPIAAQAIAAIPARTSTFVASPILPAVSAVAGLSSMQLPAPALTTFLPTVSGTCLHDGWMAW